MPTGTIELVEAPTAVVPTSQPSDENAICVDGEARIAIRGVTWEFYEHFVDGIPEHSHIRTAFDGKDLEIMTKSGPHEDFRDRIHELIKVVTQELGIPCKGLGETTWKRPAIARGIEADQCYYFQIEKMKLARASLTLKLRDIKHYPNPDLAIEIDISTPQVDRPGIYAAMGVAEVWRFDGEALVIERLTPEHTYVTVEQSGYVPISSADIVRWILDDEDVDDTGLSLRLRAWVKAELVPRIEPKKTEPEAPLETESA